MWLRVGLAISRTDDDGFMISAAGPSVATLNVEFFRQNHSAGAVTVKAGSLVRASNNGSSFKTLTDAVFNATDLGPITAAAQSVGFGYEYNVPGIFVDPKTGDSEVGWIDTIDLPIQDPPFGDPSIMVRNLEAAVGGRPASLDLHGDERDMPRRPNESDPSYLLRLQAAIDTVSPNAIRRQLQRYIDPSNLEWIVVENWSSAYQGCFDAVAGPSALDPNYSETRFVLDDPNSDDPIFNRYLGVQDHVGAFTVQIDQPPVIEEYSFALDDTAATTDADQISPLGRRAVSAYDVPITMPEPSLAPAFDGVDFGVDDFLSGLLDMLDRVKAFGVLATVYVVPGATS